MKDGRRYRFGLLIFCSLALIAAAPPLQHPFGGPGYLGTVRSIPIPLGSGGFTAWGPMAYDTKRDAFYIAYNNNGNNLLVRLKTNGAVTPIADLPSMPVAFTYDPVDDTVYATQSYTVYSISQRGLVLPIAGGTQGTLDGQGAQAQFQAPQGIVADPINGDLFVADNDRVRRVTRAGKVTTMTPPGSFGPTSQSSFTSNPEGIAFDPVDRSLFVTDPFQQKIWHVVSKTVKLVAGQCVNRCDPLQRDGPLTYALFAGPYGAVFDPTARALYVVDNQNNQVRMVNHDGVTTLAGNGASGAVDGLAYKAEFASPTQAMLDGKPGELAVLDNNNNAIRFISTTGPPPPPPPHGITMYDPPSAESRPEGLALGLDGSVWFTESTYNQIGRLQPNGTFVEYPGAAGTASFGRIVLGGDGNMWYAAYGPSGAEIDSITDGGTIAQYSINASSFNQIADVVLGSDGNIWFCETYGTVGSMTPAGAVSTYFNLTGLFVANGPAATFWLSNFGSLTQFTSDDSILRQLFLPITTGDMILGPNGDEWLAQPGALDKVAKHTVLKYLLPLSKSNQTIYVGDIAAGKDQNIWFAEDDASIGRMTRNGAYKKFIVPAPRSFPNGIIASPDGSIWFIDSGAMKIGRYH